MIFWALGVRYPEGPQQWFYFGWFIQGLFPLGLHEPQKLSRPCAVLGLARIMQAYVIPLLGFIQCKVSDRMRVQDFRLGVVLGHCGLSLHCGDTRPYPGNKSSGYGGLGISHNNWYSLGRSL